MATSRCISETHFYYSTSSWYLTRNFRKGDSQAQSEKLGGETEVGDAELTDENSKDAATTEPVLGREDITRPNVGIVHSPAANSSKVEGAEAQEPQGMVPETHEQRRSDVNEVTLTVIISVGSMCHVRRLRWSSQVESTDTDRELSVLSTGCALSAFDSDNVEPLFSKKLCTSDISRPTLSLPKVSQPPVNGSQSHHRRMHNVGSNSRVDATY